MSKNIYWYELCFFGDEDTEGEKYDANKACSYVIKTEIPPVIDDKIALKILFGEPRDQREKELIENCTCVMEISEGEAQFFDVEGLAKRIESEYGTYYTRQWGNRMIEYTVRKYEKEDYDTQKEIINSMSRKELGEKVREIAESWLPTYTFSGEESDFTGYKLQMVMDRAAGILESDPPENNPLEEVLEIQEGYQILVKNKKLTKKAMCDLVIPFRDKYKLADWQALRIARDELSVAEIVRLLK